MGSDESEEAEFRLSSAESQSSSADEVESDFEDENTTSKRKRPSPSRQSERQVKQQIEALEKPSLRSIKDLEVATDKQKQEYASRESCPQIHQSDDENILPQDDDSCRICFSDSGDPSNCIVYCDGCDFGAHQLCYAVDIIPEGDWFCRRCVFRKEKGDENLRDAPNENLFPSEPKSIPHPEYQDFQRNPNFAIVCKFLHRFGIPGLKMPPVGIEELCKALLYPKDNAFLVDLHVRLLSKMEIRGISHETWQECLERTLSRWVSHKFRPIEEFSGETDVSNPLSQTSYDEISVQSRILLLRLLCDWQFYRNKHLQKHVQEDLDKIDFRDTPIGYDKTGHQYWLIEDEQHFWLCRCQRDDGSQWETICTTAAELDKFVQYLVYSHSSPDLKLWHTLFTQIAPYLKRKEEAVQRAAVRVARASRKLGHSGLDLSAIIFDEVDEDTGRRSRRSRKAVDYTFKNFEDSIDDSISTRKTLPVKENENRTDGYDPNKYASRRDRMMSRQTEIEDVGGSVSSTLQQILSDPMDAPDVQADPSPPPVPPTGPPPTYESSPPSFEQPPPPPLPSSVGLQDLLNARSPENETTEVEVNHERRRLSLQDIL